MIEFVLCASPSSNPAWKFLLPPPLTEGRRFTHNRIAFTILLTQYCLPIRPASLRSSAYALRRFALRARLSMPLFGHYYSVYINTKILNKILTKNCSRTVAFVIEKLMIILILDFKNYKLIKQIGILWAQNSKKLKNI